METNEILQAAMGGQWLFKKPERLRVDRDPVSFMLWNINRIYCKYVHNFVWEGEDPLPAEGPAILVCNHQSSVDPFILAACTRRMLSFLIAGEYFNGRAVQWFFDWMACIPVRRDQKDVGAVRKSLMALKQGRLLCIFPEGGIDRGFKDVHLGTAYLAGKSGAPVIPAAVVGTPQHPSVYQALITPSFSDARFGAICGPPPVSSARSGRRQITAWTDQLMRMVSELRD